jgi:O-antigen ligase
MFLALSRAAILSLGVAWVFWILLYFKTSFKTIIFGVLILATTGLYLKDTIFEYTESNEAVSNDGQLVNHFSSVTNVQSDSSNLERINRWVCALRMFETRPFLGYGPGTYQFEYNAFQSTADKTYISTNSGDKGNAHSEYLTYLSETGLFGLIIFLLTVFGSIYYGMQNHERCNDPLLRAINLGVLLGLVTYYFHGIFNSFMDQSKMGILYFTALGTIVWINQYVNQLKKTES